MSENGEHRPLDILVVDDDEAVARLVRTVLERQGLTVGHVLDGRAALELLAERGARVLLTDYTMPGMNGLQLVREVEQRGHRALFLVMSAFLEPAVMEQLCAEPAVAGVLGKPFDLARLVGDVRTALEAASC